MAYGLEEFCRDCHDALAGDKGPGGREKVRQLVEKVLAEKDFVTKYFGPDIKPGRTKLYEDSELEFVVLAHVNDKAHSSPPHDHGTSWAVYGQATEYTDMSEFRRKDTGTGAGKAEIEHVKTYRLTPGKAGVYDVRAIHAIDYPDNARFLRVTGRDLNLEPRLVFDQEKGQARMIENASASG